MLEVSASSKAQGTSIEWVRLTQAWWQNAAQLFLEATHSPSARAFQHAQLTDELPTSATARRAFSWSLKILLLATEEQQQVLVPSLHEEGHIVLATSTISDAQYMGREHVFDLVLLDATILSVQELTRFISWWQDETHGMLDPLSSFALIDNTQQGTCLLEQGSSTLYRSLFLPWSQSQPPWAKLTEHIVNHQLGRGLEPGIQCAKQTSTRR